MPRPQYDAAVVGGGFFGCSLALSLRDSMGRVLLLEKEPDILRRASYANQARVHNGYHYPRSLLTALRSRVNFARFVEDYRDCIDDDFKKYYAVSRTLSKVTATQFRSFCERIGGPIAPAPKEVRKLFNPDLIEDVFLVTEYAFDADKLRAKIARELSRKDIEIELNSEAVQVSPAEGQGIEVLLRTGGQTDGITAKHVFNCTYSRTNRILAASDLPTLPLRHELTEIALIDVPDQLRDVGITIMCGPFFSTMPFPARGLHSLSHVRYTPHYSWHDGEGPYTDPDDYLYRTVRKSNYPFMIKDAQRYVPALRECRYVDSIWEVKTVLPSSEVDDSRPILFIKDQGLANLTCIMGGKIDNIYDMLYQLECVRTQGGWN
jgi:glycine/D-amino acid oxidase-like deaminating enzyme